MDQYVFVIFICGVAFLFGLILITINHILKKRRNKEIFRFISGAAFGKCKKLILESISESMDILPNKIAEVKNAIDGE